MERHTQFFAKVNYENLQIREFENAIQNFINGSPLPLEVKRLVISEIGKKIDDQTNAEIIKEINERNEEEKREDNAESVQQE